jgi:hypothetical protein
MAAELNDIVSQNTAYWVIFKIKQNPSSMLYFRNNIWHRTPSKKIMHIFRLSDGQNIQNFLGEAFH